MAPSNPPEVLVALAMGERESRKGKLLSDRFNPLLLNVEVILQGVDVLLAFVQGRFCHGRRFSSPQ